ncbi:carbohydrate porin [Rhodoferax sp.]|uniref:carbohydrate porin n=1 Tax=Rhodoferax sp. TaxID=50421 RepID=UPI0025D7781F|nr:carbohydrate porin [Rhodoferax sp.]
MKFFTLRATVAAASLLAAGGHAFAQAANDVPVDATLEKQITQVVKKVTDATGLEFTGYLRSGFYSSANGQAKGQYQLGGSLSHYRLGNEGDNYFEVLIGKNWDLGGGVKWGVHWMPNYYNGTTGTPQIYSDITGLSFAPNVSFWAGQRFHRVQDIHIIDQWLMQDGDNYGAGADGIDVGFGKLNLAVYSDGNSDNKNNTTNNARRANFQWRDLPVNPGGKLTLTGGIVNGTFAQGSNGGALGLLHNQADFIVPGLTNSFFLQGSTGHADIDGKFYNLDTAGVPALGAKQSRIIESINWQSGVFGGQALVGYQTIKPDNGVTTKDVSLGGRVSYGVAKNVKLLGELGLTQRKIDGQDKQNLTKGTFAVAFSPNTDFWTRPEFRIYATRANWNDAAAAAAPTGGALFGRTKATTVGVQVEAWW